MIRNDCLQVVKGDDDRYDDIVSTDTASLDDAISLSPTRASHPRPASAN